MQRHLRGGQIRGGDVARQAEAALALLGRARTPEAIAAALELLDPSHPEVHATILERYRHFAADPGRRDPSSEARAQLLLGLRGCANASDVPVLEAATATYEYLPPGPREVAGRLRAAGLVALAVADEGLAGFVAARLLGDPQTSDMSGEPAVTAVTVLASLRETRVLYGFLMGPGDKAEDAVAHALRALAEAPAEIVRGLAERFLHSSREIELVGLFDLLLGRPDRGSFAPLVARFLQETDRLDVYLYLATAVVAARDAELIKLLRGLQEAAPATKARLLEEALALA